MTNTLDTAAYFAFAQAAAAAAAVAVAAGDEAALDDNLCELATLSVYGKSRACRDRAARLVSLHRYEERLEEREAARLDAARAVWQSRWQLATWPALTPLLRHWRR